MNSLDLTVSIVNYNTRDLLKDCLNSAYENIKGVKFEVILVDNNSTDDSVKMIKEEFPWVTLIENGGNVGFAKANNQALNRGKGRFFLLLNSDTVLLPNSVNKMVNFMDRHSKVGAVGCGLVFPDGTPQPYIGKFLNLPSALWTVFLSFFNVKALVRSPKWKKWLARYFGSIVGKTINLYLSYYLEDGKTVQEVDRVSGACMLVRGETIKDVGLLDENFFMYAEDTDWCFRMRQRSWKIYVLPEVKVVHYVGQSPGETFTRTSPERYKSTCYFFKKYYGKKGLISLRILVTLVASIQLGLFFPPYLLSNKKEKRKLTSRLELIKLSISART